MDLSKLTDFLDSLGERFGVPSYEFVLTQEHCILCHHTGGFSDTERRVPASEGDLYRFFSATKLVTATAVLQLFEQGQLDLYDRVGKYLPEYGLMRVVDSWDLRRRPISWPGPGIPSRVAQRPIRVIDLLTMTSGMGYDMSSQVLKEARERDPSASTRKVVAAMAKLPLLYDPGDGWTYNAGHDVLAALVEVVSGMSFGTYLENNIFAPLGLRDFRLHLAEAPRERLSCLYLMGPSGRPGPDNGIVSGSFEVTPRYESGGAGLIGTAGEYAAFLDCLACGGLGRNGTRILRPETVSLMASPYTTGKQQEDFLYFGPGREGYAYGLGVRVHTGPCAARSPIGEFGWDGAAGAYAMVDPKNKLSIFYAQHVMGMMDAYASIHPALRDLTYETLEL